MAIRSVSPDIRTHKRKPHKKSRNGCANCKLRSVKCDESRPTCKKCASYGVICNYGATTRELQLSVEGANHIILPPELPYWQCRSDELLDKFQVRTALTLSFGERLQVYQKDIATLACEHTSLYHALVTLTLMHDRHISPDPNKNPSAEECYHWSRALSSFSKQLCRLPQGDEQSALLTTAAMLGMLTFYHIDATRPEEAWPLAPPSPSDLAWLKMSDGKKEVFKLTQKSNAQPTPLFRKLATLYTRNLLSAPTTNRPNKIEASVPPRIFRVYDFDPSKNADDNDDPLKWAAGRLAQALATDGTPNTVIMGFLLLIGAMRPDFKELLMQKEPRALLLLAWWFAKVDQLDLWWLSRRSVLEGQAICMYLERNYWYDLDMQKLLEYPKSVFATRMAGETRRLSGAEK